MRSSLRSRWYPVLLASLGIMISAVRNSSADQEDLMSLVRASHRAARQSIRSFSATITKEVNFPNQLKHVQSGKYWRSFDVVRLQEKVGGGSEDYLLKDSEIHQVGRGADLKTTKKHYGASRRAATDRLGTLDVWSDMMIDFAGPNGEHYDLDRFLEFAKEPPRARREQKDGRDCIRITFSVASNMGVEQNITLWHDVAHNYLVWKMIMAVKNSHYKAECDILKFEELLPGLFIPTKCHVQTFHGSEKRIIQDITLSDLQVNKPIPKNVFQLPAVPSGTVLDDHIQGTRYPIDENWRPIGSAKPLVVMKVPGRSASQAPEYHSQSTSETRSFSWWLISGSLGILIVPCIYCIYRHYRLRADLRQAD